MANIVITSSARTFKIESNVYLNAVGSPLATKKRADIKGVYYSKDSTYIAVEIEGIRDFLVAPTVVLNEAGKQINVIIDTIDAVPMTTLNDIFTAFVSLMEY